MKRWSEDIKRRTQQFLVMVRWSDEQSKPQVEIKEAQADSPKDSTEFWYTGWWWILCSVVIFLTVLYIMYIQA